MGMHAIGGGAYASTGPDLLFSGNNANHPAAPVHMPHMGKCTPICIRLEVREDEKVFKKIEYLIEKVVKNNGEAT